LFRQNQPKHARYSGSKFEQRRIPVFQADRSLYVVQLLSFRQACASVAGIEIGVRTKAVGWRAMGSGATSRGIDATVSNGLDGVRL
jgi:hypothetical protein